MIIVIFSGFIRLVRRSKIMSRPPEKIRSTATADPEKKADKYNLSYESNRLGIDKISRARRQSSGNRARRPQMCQNIDLIHFSLLPYLNNQILGNPIARND